ncbi:MAG TPA: TIGR04255 family protein [Longimicrobium sp.]|nr:TIGR04255 family protein [Longimicrobium sp.]
MAVVEVFPRAPIVEAILSLELNYLDDLPALADKYWQAIGNELPSRERTGGPAAALRPSGRLQSTSTEYRFGSEDGLHVVQVSRRAFSFHRMRPYQDWAQFSATARHFWEAFVEHFGPERISEIHLRYLNRIEIPLPLDYLQDYLALYPMVPEEIDTGSIGYLMRLSLSDPAVPALAHVTQRFEYDPERRVFPIVFDIDVSRSGDWAVTDRELWQSIEGLRDYKNRLFFESITERTRALFR